MRGQTLPDEYVDKEVEEEVEGLVEDSREEDPIDVESDECKYCRLKSSEKFTVSADMDYVYQGCRRGLIQNIRFLYRMFNDLKASGYDVAVVEKGFSDDLQVYVGGETGKNMTRYSGLSVWIATNFNYNFDNSIRLIEHDGEMIGREILKKIQECSPYKDIYKNMR